MMAEYAHAYGGPPRPETPWPMFMALLKRAPTFEARAFLRHMDATLWAIGQAFSKPDGAALQMRTNLEKLAYPWGDKKPEFLIRGGGDAGA